MPVAKAFRCWAGLGCVLTACLPNMCFLGRTQVDWKQRWGAGEWSGRYWMKSSLVCHCVWSESRFPINEAKTSTGRWCHNGLMMAYSRKKGTDLLDFCWKAKHWLKGWRWSRRSRYCSSSCNKSSLVKLRPDKQDVNTSVAPLEATKLGQTMRELSAYENTLYSFVVSCR